MLINIKNFEFLIDKPLSYFPKETHITYKYPTSSRKSKFVKIVITKIQLENVVDTIIVFDFYAPKDTVYNHICSYKYNTYTGIKSFEGENKRSYSKLLIKYLNHLETLA